MILSNFLDLSAVLKQNVKGNIFLYIYFDIFRNIEYKTEGGIHMATEIIRIMDFMINA